MTMTLIETVTLGSNQASIDFNSIPATFTDLYLVTSLRCNRSDFAIEEVHYKFNNATTNRSMRRLFGGGYDGSGSPGSGSDTVMMAGVMPGSSTTSNTFGSVGIYIPNYAGSTYKSSSADGVTESNDAYYVMQHIVANLWSSTSAITSISVYGAAGNSLIGGSTASLYGILKGSGGATVS